MSADGSQEALIETLRDLLRQFAEHHGDALIYHYDQPIQCAFCEEFANELGYIKHAAPCLIENARLAVGLAEPEPTQADWEEYWSDLRRRLETDGPELLTTFGKKLLAELN